MQNSKIRFLHIQKTAGSSFQQCLNRIYFAHRLLSNTFIFYGDTRIDLERYLDLPQRQRDRLKVIGGHAPLVTGVHEIDELPTITFLRHPIERFKSFIVHLHQGKSKGINPSVAIDILKDPIAYQADNFQVRTLLGYHGYDLPNLTEDELVARAMNVLENKLVAYGITEHFDDSLLYMKHTLNWKKQPVYSHLNQKSRSDYPFLTSNDMERIELANRIDMRVYLAAKAIFDKRIEEGERALDDMRRGFELSQRIYAPVFYLLNAIRAVRRQISARNFEGLR